MKVTTRHRLYAAVVLVGLTTPGCDLATGAFTETASDEWRRSYTLDGGVVEIGNVNGAITLEAVPGNRVEVTALRQAHARSPEAAEDLLRRIEIREESDLHAVRIETRPPRLGGLFSGRTEVRYTVRVPADARVVLTTTNGHVTARGVQGGLEATTTNGRIEASGIAGAVETRTTNGRIDVQIDALAEGGVRSQTTNGRVSVALPASAAATVDLEVTNGSIDVTGLELEHTGEVTRRRVAGRLNGGGAPVSIRTTNGAVSLIGQ